MPHADAQPTPVGLPIKGVDQGSPSNAQPPGTCPDARNVRAYAYEDRVRVGKRDGTEKAFTTQIGSSLNGREVIHLAGFNASGTIPVISGATEPSAESDDFTALTAAQNPVDPGNYIGARMRTSDSEVLLYDDILTNSTPGTSYLAIADDVNPASEYFAVISRWATANDLTVTFVCQEIDSANATGEIATNYSCHRCALLVAMNNRLTAGAAIRVERGSGDDKIKLQIVDIVNGSGVTTIGKESAELTLPNPSSTTWRDDLILTSSVSGTTLTATLSWESQSLSTSTTADLASDFSADYSGNVRAGFGYVGGDSVSGADDPFRWIKSCSYTALKPSVPTATESFRGTDTATGVNNFFVPDGLTSVGVSAGGDDFYNPGTANESKVEGLSSSTTPSGAFEEIPCIDDSTGVITVGDFPSADDFAFVTQTDQPEEREYVILNQRGVTGDEIPGFVTRVSDDFLSFIYFRPVAVIQTAEATVGFANYEHIGGIQAEYVSAGSTIRDESIGLSDADIIFRFDDYVTWQDDGTDVVISVNGMEMYRYTLNASDLATVITAGDSNRTGLAWDVGTGDDTAGGGYWVSTGTGSFNQGDSNTTVVAFTPLEVYSGDIDDGTLTEITGVGLQGPAIVTGSYARKIYAVDGRVAKIIDPNAGTITSWTDTVGTLDIAADPPRLCCFYRGRAVIARFASNPALWYMSRIAAPTDFDFGSDPVETSAVAGTNADVGQPPDIITCLIPFSDDFLIFGCGNSIWVMDGDPGYGGALQNVSYQTGIVGQRAWVFDENAVLYFVSQGGLCRMLPGSRQIENVSGRRMARVLDNVNLDTTLVQCAYDSYRQHVHILLTPTTSQAAGVHAVYDTQLDAFWLDEYPVDHGPFSVLSTYGESDEDRRFIFGGRTGYIYRHGSAGTAGEGGVNGDDGEIISSYVRFAPIGAPGGVLETKLVEMHADGDWDSDIINWAWLTAENEDRVNDVPVGSATNSGTWDFSTGFANPVRLRQRSPTHQLYVSHADASDTWALERVMVYLAPGGRRRSVIL